MGLEVLDTDGDAMGESSHHVAIGSGGIEESSTLVEEASEKELLAERTIDPEQGGHNHVEAGVSGVAETSPAGADDGEDDDDDDDDFGSFDDASFDEPQQVESFESNTTVVSEPVHTKSISTTFPESAFDDEPLFLSKLGEVLDTVFSEDETKLRQDARPSARTMPPNLLADRSEVIFNQLSAMPHLRPSNWIRSNIRHNLLIKLGIPINLDEISIPPPPSTNTDTTTTNHTISRSGSLTSKESTGVSDSSNLTINPNPIRRKSISAKDIHWDQFDIPPFSSLKISNEDKQLKLQHTNEILSRIETDNLDHSSRQYLESHSDRKLHQQLQQENNDGVGEDETSDDQFIQLKLQQLRHNYQELQQLASCWIENTNELHKDFEIYENVVQNLIGYSQKLRRDEIFENLKKVKSKKKASKRKLWK